MAQCRLRNASKRLLATLNTPLNAGATTKMRYRAVVSLPDVSGAKMNKLPLFLLIFYLPQARLNHSAQIFFHLEIRYFPLLRGSRESANANVE